MGYALTDLRAVRVVSKVHADTPEVVCQHELYLKIFCRGDRGRHVVVPVGYEGGDERGREAPVCEVYAWIGIVEACELGSLISEDRGQLSIHGRTRRIP